MTRLPAIGEYWPKRGGHFMGLVLGPANETRCLVMADQRGEQLKALWGTRNLDVPAAENSLDGMHNTLAMAEAGSTLARWALQFECDGHRDFCIPSLEWLRVLRANSAGLLAPTWYWSSTQSSLLNAWVQHFDSPLGHLYNKDREGHCRLVRTFALAA